jgi:hypothetical protein
MTFVEVLHGLSQLGTFDHGACDAILKARAIDIPNAYSPGKAGTEDSVYFGFAFIVTWLSGVAVMNWLYFKGQLPMGNSDPHRLGRWMLPAFLILGAVGLCAQLSGMANYAETCRGLLHL